MLKQQSGWPRRTSRVASNCRLSVCSGQSSRRAHNGTCGDPRLAFLPCLSTKSLQKASLPAQKHEDRAWASPRNAHLVSNLRSVTTSLLQARKGFGRVVVVVVSPSQTELFGLAALVEVTIECELRGLVRGRDQGKVYSACFALGLAVFDGGVDVLARSGSLRSERQELGSGYIQQQDRQAEICVSRSRCCGGTTVTVFAESSLISSISGFLKSIFFGMER